MAKLSLNELQYNSINKLRETLRWSHSTDIIVRKDGQDFHFEGDWLRDAIDLLISWAGISKGLVDDYDDELLIELAETVISTLRFRDGPDSWK